MEGHVEGYDRAMTDRPRETRALTRHVRFPIWVFLAKNFTQLLVPEPLFTPRLSRTAEEPLSHLGFQANVLSEAALGPVERRSRAGVEKGGAPRATWLGLKFSTVSL